MLAVEKPSFPLQAREATTSWSYLTSQVSSMRTLLAIGPIGVFD